MLKNGCYVFDNLLELLLLNHSSLRAGHGLFYLIFLKRFECLNEITLVYTLEKTWSAVTEMGEWDPVPRKKCPNLHHIYPISYIHETLIQGSIPCPNSNIVKTYQQFWGNGAVRPPTKCPKLHDIYPISYKRNFFSRNSL